MTRGDHQRVTDAIRAAEARTSGEIVCVLARASSNYAHFPVLWAAFVALAVPWPLVVFTLWPVQGILAAQLAVFALATLALSVPQLRILLVPGPMRRARACNMAQQQFSARGLTRTRGRCGILIFVSLAERTARIIADVGIAEKVPQATWDEAVYGLVDAIRQGRTGEGFAHAIGRCADVLAQHFPRRDEDSNELPDRLYLM